MEIEKKKDKQSFTSYQVFVIVILAFLQFTIILDFMVMAPMGDILMKSLQINPSQFGLVVSAYAFSAGGAGLMAAGFADKYDRKKLLLFFYCGFLIGTLLCGIATNYYFLLSARIITGLFGGVIGSVSMAIVTDLFKMEQRGRVMGFVQMSFAISQVLGIPFGLYLANRMGWHAPFILIVAVSGAVGIVITRYLKPVTGHLALKQETNALKHLSATLSLRYYRRAFLTTALLSIGGFLMMPFTTPFLVNNVEISQESIPMVFMVTGVCSMVVMPVIGKISDKVGKFRLFVVGTIISMLMVAVYVNLPPSPLWLVLVINGIMFAGIMSRIIPSAALMTAIPTAKDRGAFMAINASTQQIAGGIAAVVAGLIIVQQQDGKLLHFDWVGYLGMFIMVVCGLLMYTIDKWVSNKLHQENV